MSGIGLARIALLRETVAAIWGALVQHTIPLLVLVAYKPQDACQGANSPPSGPPQNVLIFDLGASAAGKSLPTAVAHHLIFPSKGFSIEMTLACRTGVFGFRCRGMVNCGGPTVCREATSYLNGEAFIRRQLRCTRRGVIGSAELAGVVTPVPLRWQERCAGLLRPPKGIKS